MTGHRANHIIKIELSGCEGLKTNTFSSFGGIRVDRHPAAYLLLYTLLRRSPNSRNL
jgi:hypothetical protein